MTRPLVALTSEQRKRISWFSLPLSPSAISQGYLPVPASEHRRFYLRRNYRLELKGIGAEAYECLLQRYGRRKTRVQIDKVEQVLKDLAFQSGDAVLLGVLDKRTGSYAVRRLAGDKRVDWYNPEVKCLAKQEQRYGYVALAAIKKPKGRGRKWVMEALLVGKRGNKERTRLMIERLGTEKRPVFYLSGLRDWFIQERVLPNDVLIAQVSRSRASIAVHLADGVYVK